MNKEKILAIMFFSLSSIEGFFLFIWLVLKKSINLIPDTFIPSLKFSLLILIISLFFLLIGLLFLVRPSLFEKIFNYSQQMDSKYPKLRFFGFITLGAAYLAVILLLQKHFGVTNYPVKYYFTSLDAWMNLILFQGIFFLMLIKKDISFPNFNLRYMIILGSLFLIWVLIALSGIGLIPDDKFWNVAGIPVSAVQVITILCLSLVIDSFFTWLNRKAEISQKNYTKWINLGLCVFLWLAATIIWINTPFGHSFFTSGPFPPNNDFAPYSDSAVMDLGGQYMLIGRGFNYPFLTEKSLYVFFLGLLHLLAGQNYLSVTALQIAFFAIFPVLLFLLGEKAGGRFFGLFVAFFAIIKERNAIISTFQVSVSNSRLYLTEFPTAIGMLALALLLFLWFRQPHKRSWLIITAGAVLGASSMIRTNPLVLLPIILGFALLVYHFEWKKWLKSCLWFILGFLIVISPWLIYDQVVEGTNIYSAKVGAVLAERFNIAYDQPTQSHPSLLTRDTYILNRLPAEKGTTNTQTPLNLNSQEKSTNSAGKIVLGHFLNNEIKALFILPFQSYPQDLHTVLTEAYWKEPIQWQGALPLGTIAAFVLNLGIIALGINFGWSKWHYSGLVPLLVNIGYYLSNALGRTSGSRYLLAADWTIYFYYCAGLALIVQWLILKNRPLLIKLDQSYELQQSSTNRLPPVWITCLSLLVFSCSIPLINSIFPKINYAISNQEIISKLAAANFEKNTGVTSAQLLSFTNNGGTILYGRELYPRYISAGSIDGKPGLFFTLINDDLGEVYLPFDNVPQAAIQGGEDMIAIGCHKETYFQASYVYLFDQKGTLFQTSGSNTPLQSCPH